MRCPARSAAGLPLSPGGLAATLTVTLSISLTAVAGPVEQVEVFFAGDVEDYHPQRREDACLAFSKLLRIGQGPLGQGIFARATCRPSRVEPNPNAAQLRIHLGPEAAELTLSVTIRGKTETAAIAFTHGGYPTDLLERPATAVPLAHGLLNQLPYTFVFAGKHTDPQAWSIPATRRLPAPQELVTFGLKRQDGRWRPTRPRWYDVVKSDESWRFRPRSPDTPTRPAVGVLIMNRHAALAHNAKRLATAAEREAAELEANFLSGVVALRPNQYTGVRFGIPLLPGDLIEKTQYFGLVSEISGGGTASIRFYFDWWPEVEDRLNGGEARFGGQRLALAYSFGLGLGGLISKVDVTPRLGVWNFTSIIPASPSESVEMQVDRALSTGVEAGIENSAWWYTLRGWVNHDISVAGSVTNQDTEITTQRIGADLIAKPFADTSWTLKPSLLGFIFREQVSLAKRSRLNTSELFFFQAYAGMGVAVSW